MRLNLMGGPGTGKSLSAARLFAQLKERHFSVELVNEFAKAWVTEGRKITEETQTYFLGKQMHYESRWLNNGVQNIVTDSPVLVGPLHAEKYVSKALADALYQVSTFYDARHPYHFIFLQRGDYPYQSAGRFQTEAEARAMDDFILQYITSRYPPEHVSVVRADDPQGILDVALTHIDV